MSHYQTLYRKYRSQTFSDLVGQEAVSRALQGAIISGRVSHAYLFSGTRGTGKTSTARLLAKALNCTGRPEGSPEPCNSCESCRQVVAGAALDLIEIDAASNRGIDEIRDLREKVHLAPALGGRKVYIIDEAHMLTPEAFNALLKTLEEPPAHVVFILCTTEAQKVPLTVLGRCQQFVFRRFGEEEIVGRLRHIAGREAIRVDPEALLLIARVSQGSMRDAIGLLDQLVPMADGGISLESARELLGIADPALVADLLSLVLAGRASDALALLARIYDGGVELRQLVRALMERCRDFLLSALDRGDDVMRGRLSEVLDSLLHLDGEVRRHAEPRFLVEATVVRLAVLGAVAARTPADVRTPAADMAASAPAAPAVDSAPRPAPAGEIDLVMPPPVAPLAAPEVAAPAPGQQPAVASESGAGAMGVDLAEGWRTVLKGLKPSVRAFFLDARPEREGSTLVLWFRYGFHHKSAQAHAADVQRLVAEWLGDSVTLDFRLQESSSTVASAPRPPAPEEHPLVQAAVRELEGRVTRVREVSQ